VEFLTSPWDKTIYFQLLSTPFWTKDSMGQFYNSCLEQFAKTLKKKLPIFPFRIEKEIQVIMSILSNYVPNCIVRAEVSLIVDLQKTYWKSARLCSTFRSSSSNCRVEPFEPLHTTKEYEWHRCRSLQQPVMTFAQSKRAYMPMQQNQTYTSLSHAKIENDTLPLARNGTRNCRRSNFLASTE
jgi:hydroxymethylglutaryl-CoA reductase